MAIHCVYSTSLPYRIKNDYLCNENAIGGRQENIIPGTEDMTDAYHDYLFHIKGAPIGMLLGIPAALVAGLIVMLL